MYPASLRAMEHWFEARTARQLRFGGAPSDDLAATKNRWREYWTRVMDEAYAFMQRIREYPVVECGEPVAHLQDAVARSGIDARFVSNPHAEGLPRLFYLRESVAEAFLGAAAEMNARGWAIVVEDGYRTARMQRALARSEGVLTAIADRVVWETPNRAERVSLLSRRMAALVANWPRTGTHMSASAIDISVLDQHSGIEIDRGAPYLELSWLSPMNSPFVTGEAAEHRRQITEVMARHGFIAYPYEFWHYSSGDTFAEYLTHSGRPSRFGPVSFDCPTGAVTPLADADAELNPMYEIEELASEALQSAEARQSGSRALDV
jgi:D-alanyl-D-alanine dipeptidase